MMEYSKKPIIQTKSKYQICKEKIESRNKLNREIREILERYLPTSISYLDKDTNEVKETINFEYDSDYLGYKQTREYDDGTKRRIVKTVRFSSDFSSYDWEQVEYKYKDSAYKLDFAKKGTFVTYENGSTKDTQYLYDNDLSDYIFYGERCHEYNKFGEETLNSYKVANSQKPGSYYYSSYTETEYNDAGYKTKVTEYDYDRTIDRNLYVSCVDEYVYNNDFTECTINELYLNASSGQLERDGYTLVSISEDALGRKTFNEQIYTEGGNKGNQNITIYDKDWKTLYQYCGGFPETTSVSFNDKDQLTYYLYSNGIDNIVLTINLTHNDDLVTKTELIKEGLGYSSNCNCVYTFNNAKQLTQVDVVESYISKENIGNDEHLATKIIVSYSNVVNDKLLSQMTYVEDIFNSYTQNEIDRYFRLY